MNIIKDHTQVNYTSGNSGRNWIVIHYTGNVTDTAKGNANYFRTVNRQASAHYFVDENNVVEVVSPNDTAWAVGVDYGGKLFSQCKNANSISIEMCGTNGKVGDNTFKQTVDLTKSLMQQYNIDVDHVVRHYDVCAKRCPGWDGWLPNNETLWQQFKAKLSTNESQGIRPNEVNGVYRLYNPNTGEHVYTTSADEVFNLTKAGWGYENIAWHHGGNIKVYRLYSGSDHMYTVSPDEVISLLEAGWKWIGVAFLSKKQGEGSPVFRLYNKGNGKHFYTINSGERDNLVKAGWELEGVAFYADK